MLYTQAGRMSKAREFRRGGIAIPIRAPFRSSPIENAFLPMHAIVTLRTAKDHKESAPVVGVGQEVREGQLVAKSSGKGSPNCHSPIPGIVRRIERIAVPGGFDSTAIVISLEGSFSVLGKRPERYLWKSLNKTDLIHIIQDKGIVGVASGEPLHESLHSLSSRSGFTLIVNALEMDPYRRVEEELLCHAADDVIDGCAIAARVGSPAAILIAVDDQFPHQASSGLARAIEGSGLGIEIRTFKRKYPQDMPSQLIETLGLAGGPSPFITEPSTLVALHEAVVSNKPHIEQYVYVGGGAVKRSAVLKARIGAPIGDLIEECGGLSGKPEVLVIGGPFRGRAAADLDTPVTRTTRAVLGLSGDETRSAPERACVRCGDCVVACPEGLDPQRLRKLIRAGRIADAELEGLGRCSSCGACAYACRSRLPLVMTLDAARETVRQK